MGTQHKEHDMEQVSITIEGIKIPISELPEIEELPRSLQEVARIIGVIPAIKLSSHFRGTTVLFPTMSKLKRKIRNAAIREDYDRGLTGLQVALKYRMSARQIWHILSSTE